MSVKAIVGVRKVDGVEKEDSQRNERDPVVYEEGDGSVSGSLLSTVLSSGRAAARKERRWEKRRTRERKEDQGRIKGDISTTRGNVTLEGVQRTTLHAQVEVGMEMRGYVRKHPSKLADQSSASPQPSGLVEERRDLGGGTAVPGRETEEESVATNEDTGRRDGDEKRNQRQLIIIIIIEHREIDVGC
jgi:hypothetical protein